MGLPWWLNGKEFACNAGDAGSISRSRRSHEEGNGNTFQYACLGSPMDREAGRLQSMGLKESDMTSQLQHGYESKVSSLCKNNTKIHLNINLVHQERIIWDCDVNPKTERLKKLGEEVWGTFLIEGKHIRNWQRESGIRYVCSTKVGSMWGREWKPGERQEMKWVRWARCDPRWPFTTRRTVKFIQHWWEQWREHPLSCPHSFLPFMANTGKKDH